MNRRDFVRTLAMSTLGVLTTFNNRVYAKTYLTPDQAKRLIWSDLAMVQTNISLTEQQQKSIQRSSGIRVWSRNIRALKSSDNHWLIYDQVIGKHENIDIAVGLTNEGKVKAVEVLVYRESYGHQVLHPKWLGQFVKKSASDRVKVDKNIVNISGATLSCVHLTDGVNRLTHTWNQVLQYI